MKLFILLCFPALLMAQSQPIELGNVNWLRTMDDAKMRSQKEQRPIFILFQEVPGCATCRNYGSNVLTHPLIVEAIETEFVPLAIFNNKGGHDGEILKQFSEPSWNNPVVRIVDADGKDIVSRLSGNYSLHGLTQKINAALTLKNSKAPGYLQLLHDELTAQERGVHSATYSMYCFWTGEALFGKIKGVVKTTAAFQGGKEVVVVEYNPDVISKTELDKIAMTQNCRAEASGNARPDSTPKYYLSKSRYKHISMTELQKCRVNSALAEGQSPDEFLSPRQLAMVN